jgi:hypothetical protein
VRPYELFMTRGIDANMNDRHTRAFPHAREIARLLGHRSVSAFCSANELNRLALYRALAGSETARKAVRARIGDALAEALFGSGVTP